MSSKEQLSPEFYEERAKHESEMAEMSEQEPSYDEQAPDIYDRFALQHTRIAELIKERDPFTKPQTPEDVSGVDVEALKLQVLAALEGATANAAPQNSVEPTGIFKNKSTTSKTTIHEDTSRMVTISDVETEDTLLSLVSRRKSFFKVTELDGYIRQDVGDVRPALVMTEFEIDKQSGELAVFHTMASTVTPELAPVFPSYGIAEKSTAAQWLRLSQLVTPKDPRS